MYQSLCNVPSSSWLHDCFSKSHALRTPRLLHSKLLLYPVLSRRQHFFQVWVRHFQPLPVSTRCFVGCIMYYDFNEHLIMSSLFQKVGIRLPLIKPVGQIWKRHPSKRVSQKSVFVFLWLPFAWSYWKKKIIISSSLCSTFPQGFPIPNPIWCANVAPRPPEWNDADPRVSDPRLRSKMADPRRSSSSEPLTPADFWIRNALYKQHESTTRDIEHFFVRSRNFWTTTTTTTKTTKTTTTNKQTNEQTNRLKSSPQANVGNRASFNHRLCSGAHGT